ncbi:MAG: helix-hairpin-helix domain-containing protein [Ruminiclostridium sp.]|nr:helix-hairpin-helix domain-containing protein [Ruminiclostridium sp.]
MNGDANKSETGGKPKRFTLIFCAAATLYLAACAVIYVLTTVKEQDAYVTVTPMTHEADIIPLSERVNINTASPDELTSLNGIGEVTAVKIVEYREEYGGFLSIDELVKVNGIGEKLLDKLRPYITI